MDKRPQPVREAVLAALAIISHYEDKDTGQKISLHDARLLPRNTLRSVGSRMRTF